MNGRAQAARGETFSFDDLDALLVDRVDGLDLTSFSVPVSVQTLQRTQCKSVITEPGVYVVLRPNREHPVFLPQSVGGKKSGQDLSYPLEVVSRKWIAEATILYTGKTSDVGGLRARLKSYMNFGLGKSTSHRGGRLIWQLQNHRQLFIRWLAIPSGHPEEVEKEILQHFRRERGELPFANFKC